MNEKESFIAALAGYVTTALEQSGVPADYNTDAVHIVDARNHLFRAVHQRTTDEAEDIYAIRDLCRVDEDTMEYVVDRGRLSSVARNFGLTE